MNKIFGALADLNRLRIIIILQKGPLNVSEICSVLYLSQSNVSHHLKKLLDAGLVRRRGISGWVYYELLKKDQIENGLFDYISSRSETLSNNQKDMYGLSLLNQRRRQKSEEFFDSSAGKWSEIANLLPDPETYMHDMIGCLPKNGIIAELGCGTGVMLQKLASFSEQVIGIDQSREMLSKAQEIVNGNGLEKRIDLRLGNLEHLPLSDNCLDGALANMVLHHIAEPKKVFIELRRVLKESGVFVIADLLLHENPDLKTMHGDLWPGFSSEEITGWLKQANLVETGVKKLEENGVFIVTAVKGGKE